MVHFRGPAPAYYRKLSLITLQMGRASGMFMNGAIDTFKKHSKQWKDEVLAFIATLNIFKRDKRFDACSSPRSSLIQLWRLKVIPFNRCQTLKPRVSLKMVVLRR